MAKKVKQLRYYGNGNSNNFPDSISADKLSSQYEELTNKKIVSLSIQTQPGVKFKLNNSENWIYVGYTGVYELDIDGYAEINYIKFDNLNLVNSQANGYLIIDIVYKEGDD